MYRVLSGLRGWCNSACRSLGMHPRGSGSWPEIWKECWSSPGQLGGPQGMKDIPGKSHSTSKGKKKWKVFCWENLQIFKRTKGRLSCSGWHWTLGRSYNIDRTPSALTLPVHTDCSFCHHLLLCMGAFSARRSMFCLCAEWAKVLRC